MPWPKLAAALLAVFAALALSVPASAHGDQKHAAPDHVETSATGNAASEAAGLDMPASDNMGRDTAPERMNDGADSIIENLHPATVHFPIALLIMAALTELFAMLRPSTDLTGAVRVMIYGGTAGAVIAALFGWIHTGMWTGGEGAMQAHRIIGTALPLLALGLAVLAGRDGSRTLLRFGLFAVAGLLLVQGYLGGELAHGPDHLGFG